MTLQRESVAASAVATGPQAWRRGRSAVVLGLLLVGTAILAANTVSGGSAARGQETALARVVGTAATGGEWPLDPVWAGRPPGGVVQLVGWVAGTDGLGRHGGDPVAAVREAAVLALLATVALTWLLARRLGASRIAAAVTLVVLVLAPAGLLLHRTASADALATPWLVAACCLAVGPVRRRPGPAPGWPLVAAGACAAVAVLTVPATLLLLPVPAALIRRHRAAEGARPLAAAGATLTGLLGGYGLIVGVAWLSDAQSGPLAGAGLGVWGPVGTRAAAVGWATDPVVLTLAAGAAVLLVVRSPSARPVAAGVLGWLTLSLMPGVLAPTGLVVVLPLAALVVTAGALELTQRRGLRARRIARITPAVVVALAAVALPAPDTAAPVATTPTVRPEPAASAPTAQPPVSTDPETEMRRELGTQLARNPGLQLSDDARARLLAGAVDPRALVVLPIAAAQGRLSVAAILDLDGVGLDESLLVTSVDGRAVGPDSTLARLVTAQARPFTAVVTSTADGLLLTWPGTPPAGLLEGTR